MKWLKEATNSNSSTIPLSSSEERVGVRRNQASARIPLLTLPLALLACTTPPPATTPNRAPTWTPVTPIASEQLIEAPAQVLADPAATTVLAPPYRATVVRIRARVGDTVDAGTPLLDVLMPELLEAAGRAEGATARLEAWTARQRQLEQLRTEGLARALDLSEATARVAEAKSDLQAARAILISAGVSPQQGSTLLAGTGALTLRAPTTGVITKLAASPGASREPGAPPLAEVMSESQTRVEARFSRAPPPGAAEFVGASGTTPLTALSRAPALDPRDGTQLAWFTPTTPLPAGLPGRVRIKVDDGGAFTVPSASIVRLEGRAGVETRKGRIDVEVVRCGADTCVVRGTLASTDEVRTP
ncbi:MAG: efflux RND transporter periplasmic adaptor subunit [Myxococcaceae bacterium]